MDPVNDSMMAMLSVVLEEFGLEFDPKTMDEYKNILGKVVVDLGMNMDPGVDRLLHHLNSNGIPMAVATNGSERDWDLSAQFITGLDKSLFSHVVCGAQDPEVINNKPAPDIYLACVKKFADPPKSLDKCVIFEDSLKGITGAVASGMKTVLVNDMRGTHFDGIKDKITIIVDSFEDFKPESVGLPPYPAN